MKSPATAKQAQQPTSITASQLESRREQWLVLDVRSGLEYLLGHIPGARQFNRERVLKDIPQQESIVVACLSGHRSQPIARWLINQGYQNVYNLQGGLMAWKKASYAVRFGMKP